MLYTCTCRQAGFEDNGYTKPPILNYMYLRSSNRIWLRKFKHFLTTISYLLKLQATTTTHFPFHVIIKGWLYPSIQRLVISINSNLAIYLFKTIASRLEWQHILKVHMAQLSNSGLNHLKRLAMIQYVHVHVYPPLLCVY